MKKRPRQDDKIENKQIKVFGLTPGPGRSNKYIEDATINIKGKIKKLELKSSSTKKKSFSTSSRMGEMKIAEWKRVVDGFIFSIFNESGGFTEHWFLTHEDMQSWYDKQLKKQYAGHAGRAGLSLWGQAEKDLKSLGWQDNPLSELKKTNQFGSRLNDPQVSLAYVRDHGTKINNSAELQKLL